MLITQSQRSGSAYLGAGITERVDQRFYTLWNLTFAQGRCRSAPHQRIMIVESGYECGIHIGAIDLSQGSHYRVAAIKSFISQCFQ
ncbi:hypothetical protein CCAX7_60240 [Capsulimonas corticalis]|uniref:Uncharacterized protein n=1 Tax=Capsulimonas corticalis TaxID=2219043 RepID=A0A402CW01_9BACT|nr:hypothetical protein CCAX7_60240 [Capsulimonas corticalis]